MLHRFVHRHWRFVNDLSWLTLFALWCGDKHRQIPWHMVAHFHMMNLQIAMQRTFIADQMSAWESTTLIHKRNASLKVIMRVAEAKRKMARWEIDNARDGVLPRPRLWKSSSGWYNQRARDSDSRDAQWSPAEAAWVRRTAAGKRCRLVLKIISL